MRGDGDGIQAVIPSGRRLACVGAWRKALLAPLQPAGMGYGSGFNALPRAVGRALSPIQRFR